MHGLKEIRIEFDQDFDTIEIIPFADIHEGDFWTDEKSIKEAVEYVLEKPNRFAILNGDLANNTTKDSVGDIYSESMMPSDQITRVKQILMPLAKKDRILAIGPGNHEERTKKAVGLDLSYWIAKEMGIEERYADNSFVLFIKFGRSVSATQSRPYKNVYTLYVWHGSGGGRKSGGKMNRMLDMAETVDCDIYIMSHTHDPMMKHTKFFRIDYSNMKVQEVNRYFLTSNAWQDFGGYGQRFGFRPISKDIVSVILNGKGKKMCKLIGGNNGFKSE